MRQWLLPAVCCAPDAGNQRQTLLGAAFLQKPKETVRRGQVVSQEAQTAQKDTNGSSKDLSNGQRLKECRGIVFK